MRKVAGFLFGYMRPGREKMRPLQIKPSDRSRISLRSSLPHRHARPCAGHPRLNMDDGGKDVDGRDGPGHDDSIASASEAIQAVHAGSPFESSESRQRPLTRFAGIRSQIDLSPHAGRGIMQAGTGARRQRRRQAPQTRRGGGVE